MLDLDEVWWLVSPQNPLKSSTDMGRYQDRLAHAKTVAQEHPNIRISDAERTLGTRYTVDTLKGLQRQNPHCDFVWIIGADNLRQMVHWKDWRTIFNTVPIAVFPRAPYSIRALGGRASRRFKAFRLPANEAKHLCGRKAPAWVFLKAPTHDQSATQIRRQDAT